MAQTEQERREADQRSKERAEQRKKDAEAAEKVVKEQNEEQQKRNKAANDRMEQSRPTPTQHENDMAKLGIPQTNKEPDGSPEERNLAPAAQGQRGYQTRTVNPQSPPQTKPPEKANA